MSQRNQKNELSSISLNVMFRSHRIADFKLVVNWTVTTAEAWVVNANMGKPNADFMAAIAKKRFWRS